MSVLGNYLELKDGVPKRLRIMAWFPPQEAQIKDSDTGELKTIRKLRLDVADLQTALRTYWDITSEKVAQQLMPYLTSGAYKSLTFTVTASGKGKRREYAIKVE